MVWQSGFFLHQTRQALGGFLSKATGDAASLWSLLRGRSVNQASCMISTAHMATSSLCISCVRNHVSNGRQFDMKGASIAPMSFLRVSLHR